jgi:beta-glucanase (GH16 family)
MKTTIAYLLVFISFSFDIHAQTHTQLVFQDEFDGKGLPDASKWEYEEGYVRNGEKQYYTSKRIENCYQKDGFLHLVALNDSAEIAGKIHPVTAASIHTKNTFGWKFGRVEVRAKLPVCLGTWPAIWLMPVDAIYGSWPKSGEIDIMEHVGYEPERVNYAIHTEAYNHTKKNGKGSNAFCLTCGSEFHVYALEWYEDRLEWHLDGKKRFIIHQPQEATWESWPFEHPFYLILNLAFGGGWGGTKGMDLEGLPQEFVIDYVRIFQ